MIKAEVIEYPGAEVPNWVTKCKDVLTSAPALGTLTLAVLALVSVFFWHGRQPSFTNTTNVQSQPVSTSSLQVVPLSAEPLGSATNQSSLQTTPSSQSNSSAVGSSSSPVGPAPTTSLNSLQPSQNAQNNSQSLTQAATQNIQSAGKATKNGLQDLNL